MRRAELIELPEQRLFIGQPLDDHLGDEVALPCQLREVGGGGDARPRLLGPPTADQTALDKQFECAGNLGLGPGQDLVAEVTDDRGIAPQREVDGDAEPHRPAADYAHRLDIG